MEQYLGKIIRDNGKPKWIRKCTTCKAIFEDLSGKKRLCSKECRGEESKCLECAETFISKKKSEKWCSVKCRQETTHKRIIAENIKDKDNTQIVECLICNKKFKQLASHLHNAHKISTFDYLEKFPNAKTVSSSLSNYFKEQIAGDKNPWFNHGGILSPFSTKNKKIESLQDEEKENIVNGNIKKWIVDMPANQRPQNKSYWVKRGCSEKEAVQKVKERQTTFSKEKCIEKFGLEEGLKVFQERQDKWQKTLSSKPEEEIERINQTKIWKSGSMSKISLELFEMINLPGSRWGKKTENNKGELQVKLSFKRALVDFNVGNKIIEFYGDYWHANPECFKKDQTIFKRRTGKCSAQELWDLDAKQKNELEQLGYKVMIVWEKDFRKDKQKVVQECLNFLNRE